MPISLSDFKKHPKHRTYLTRDLGDNGTGSGKYVELLRADGFGFGAMPEESVLARIEADKEKPVPDTGSTLAAIFGPESA